MDTNTCTIPPRTGLLEVDVKHPLESTLTPGTWVLFNDAGNCEACIYDDGPDAVVITVGSSEVVFGTRITKAVVVWASAKCCAKVLGDLSQPNPRQSLPFPMNYGQAPQPEPSAPPGQALRYNAGKPQLSYLFSAPHAIEGVAKVMEFGAQKYARDNWKKGFPYTSLADSLARHLSEFLSGVDTDQDSGLPHVDHILCNALFLSELTRIKPEFDDRGGRK